MKSCWSRKTRSRLSLVDSRCSAYLYETGSDVGRDSPQNITSPLNIVVRNGNIIQRRGSVTGRAEESPFRLAKWRAYLWRGGGRGWILEEGKPTQSCPEGHKYLIFIYGDKFRDSESISTWCKTLRRVRAPRRWMLLWTCDRLSWLNWSSVSLFIYVFCILYLYFASMQGGGFNYATTWDFNVREPESG